MIQRHKRTVRIEPSIGSKNKRKLKMAQSRDKSGDTTVATMETGRTRKNMDSEFKIMRIKTATKVAGRTISDTAKVILFI